MRRLLRRGQLWMLTVASGGGLFVLEGCDPAVRNTVLEGVSSAATSLSSTFIGAFFQSLLADEEETATTVRAIIDTASQIFA
ncbi:MAG: hypothetical protein AB1601_09495 [Planctomycetota bacterium]